MSISASDLINYARAHIQLKPMMNIGGVSNQPGLSICQDIVNILFCQSFAWKFNRVVLSQNFFVTQPFYQDYPFAGACAFALAPPASSLAGPTGQGFLGGGGVGIDLAANNAITAVGQTVTVNTLGPHPFLVGQVVYLNGVNVPGWNSTLTINTTALSSTWSNGYTVTAITSTSFTFVYVGTVPSTPAGASGLTNFSWLEAGYVTDISNTGVPQPVGPIEAVDRITPTNSTGDPEKVAMILDNGNGILTFRCNNAASATIWQVTPVYQAKGPTISSPASVFDPWPDNLGHVLRQGIKAFAFSLTDNAQRAELEFNRFNAFVAQARSFYTSESADQSIAPSFGLMRG